MQLSKLVIQGFMNSMKQFILNTNLHKILENTEGSFQMFGTTPQYFFRII